MNRKIALLIFLFPLGLLAQPGQEFFNVSPGNGNGVRFWFNDIYKMHMGFGTEWIYGPVTGYSIKTNMAPNEGWGWTWGVSEQVPIAALSVSGQMRIAGMFDAGGQSIALRLRSGNTYTGTEKSQINFSFNGGTGYTHSIRTRHNSNNGRGNAMDFYVWQPTDAVEGQGSLNVMSLDGDKVGIGTNTPAARLDIRAGEIHIEADQPLRGGGRKLISGNATQVIVGTTDPGVHIKFDAGASSRMFINGSTGKVGIGTSTPDEMLTVNGKINSEEIIVSPSVPAPDYVFEKNYDLASLDEVQAYITQHKHLPEVPSAKEMETNGVKVGVLEMILLKKVEELTLYVIELKEEINQLKKRNEK